MNCLKNTFRVKNPIVGKSIDKFLLSILAALFLFVLFYTLTDSILIGALTSILTVFFFAFLLKTVRPRSPKDRLSLRDFIRYVLLNGNEVLKKAVELSFPNGTDLKEAEGNTLFFDGNSRNLIYYAFKFGSLSEEDVAKCYRLAERYGAESIYALTNHSERKALAVTEYIPQRFSIVGASTIYKYLLKRDLIPSKHVFRHKKTKTANFFRAVINGSNVKYYLICGLSASLISLLTPLRVYYLVFAFLNLILAVLSLLFSEKNTGECEIFKH